jgi:hypothetical protein
MNYQPLSLLAFSVFFVSLSVGGQNLVPNPSFEEYEDCPGQTIGIQLATGWSDANTGTADYYNSCYTTGFVNMDVPNNFIGSQTALSGVAYAGIISYEKSTTPLHYREYVQTQISSPLIGGTEYFVSFNLAHADSCCFVTDDIGVYLSTTMINESNYLNINANPQIANVEGNLLNDNTNWVQIKGSFIATGGEEFIVLGNFKDDNSTDTLSVCTSSNLDFMSAYYYIDDVCISTDSTLCANYDYNGIKNEALINTFQIYPNPADNLLTIQNPKGVAYTYTLYNLNGSILFEQLQAQHSVKEVDLSSLAAGIYVLSIQSAGLIYNHKIAVR